MTLQRVAEISFVTTVVVLSMGVALVDVNRFIGRHKSTCGRYNDSLGGFDENGTWVCLLKGNHSRRRDPGILFGNTARSEVAWVYNTVVSILAIVLSLGSYTYRIWERHKNIREVTERLEEEHSEDHRRICLVLYLCTGLVLLYEAVVFVKVIRCHRTVAEGFYTFFSMVSLVVQGVYLMYEVSHRRVHQVRSGQFFKSILISQAILNFTLWADALFDTACRTEPDNAIFFGEDFWIICKPIFKAALVAVRILSALLFLMLAMHGQQDRHTHEDHRGEQTRERDDHIELSDIAEREHHAITAEQAVMQKKTRKYCQHVDGLDNAFRHIETAVKKLICEEHSTSNGSPPVPMVSDEEKLGRQLPRQLSTMLSVPSNVNYGVVIRLSKIGNNSFEYVAEAISSKQVATNAFLHSMSFVGLILILIPPVISGWALKLLEEDDVAKYAPEMFVHILMMVCCLFVLDRYSPVRHWTIRKHLPVAVRLKDLVHQPELSAITIFAIAANLYHLLLFIFYCEANELFLKGWPQLDVLVEIASTTLRLSVVWIFKMRHGAQFKKRNDTLTELILGTLAACSLSVLIMDIEREEFSDNEHKLVEHLHLSWVEPVLGVLAPLSVDFSLHAALLLYSVFHDYVKFSGEPGSVTVDHRYDDVNEDDTGNDEQNSDVDEGEDTSEHPGFAGHLTRIETHVETHS